MTTIELREPPARPANGRRPLMDLDKQILEIVGDDALRPVQIARALRRVTQKPPGVLFPWGEISTQRVASRLKSLVNRGLMERVRPAGGPPNGPGTSLYRKPRQEVPASDG